MQEKEYRKAISKEKRKIAQNDFIKKKRENKRIKDNFSYIQKCEIQLTDTLLVKLDNIILLLEKYIESTQTNKKS